MSLKTKNIGHKNCEQTEESKSSLSRAVSSLHQPVSSYGGASKKTQPNFKSVSKKNGVSSKSNKTSSGENDKTSSSTRFSNFPKRVDITNTKCLFYDLHEKEIDRGGLTKLEIDEARKTGVLKVNKRFLVDVPDFVWSIELPTEEDRKIIDICFDGKDNDPWWTFRPLEFLDVSQNALKTLGPKGSALFSLKELHANNNSIDVLAGEIGQCKELKILALNDNNLAHLPESICSLINLTELFLQKNNLKELPNHISDLISLKKLDISCNNFVKIPCDIGYLSGLVELNMSHNQINLLPEEIQGLRSLKVLDLSDNKLVLIPSLVEMSNLTVFIGSNNNISRFPNFCGCRRLTEIKMDNNQIKHLLIDNLQGVPLTRLLLRRNEVNRLPEDIYRLSTLVLLDVSENQLTKLPYQLARLRNLSLLLVDGNPIEGRQDILKSGTTRILAHLKRLSVESSDNKHPAYQEPECEVQSYEKTLNDVQHSIKIDMKTTNCLILTNMDLSTLPVDILQEAKEEHVFRVDLSRNKFLSIPEGLEILNKSLTEIIIKQNNLRTVPDFIGRMKHLLHLDISNNKIETLPSSMEACNLKAFIAECNCFSEIPEVVYSIKSLEHLNFCYNKISDINVNGLKNLKYLYSLNLSNNNIGKIPPELGYLTQIRELHLYGNPFKLPRYSLLSKGTDAVMAYLRDKTMKHDS